MTCHADSAKVKPAILYITRSGMLEPLGQSQVLAYLRGLSSDHRITLISFEKSEDIADDANMARVRADCAAHGIAWKPCRFRRRPPLLASAWGMMLLFALCWREVRRGNATLIHARAYIPATVAMLVGRLTGTPFIFDMRALWPEELITAGRLRRGSPVHRAIVRAERTCLMRAAAVVSLTHASVYHLQRVYPRKFSGKKVVVIPTCADLERFRPLPSGEVRPLIYGCVGTVTSGWFRLDWLAGFFLTAAEREPEAEFHVVTRDNPERVRAAIGGDEAFQRRLKVYAMAPLDVHRAVQMQRASVMFFSQGLSKLGSSPTRMGEILGCGIPLVANEGVGDVARVIRDYNVGVLAEGNSAREMETAFDALGVLMRDPALPTRCRAAAKRFSR